MIPIMKIYISLPLTGRDFEAVEANFIYCIYASGVIQSKGHTPVSPFEVSPDHDATYAEHIGTDITALLVCEAVLFLPGWQTPDCTGRGRNTLLRFTI